MVKFVNIYCQIAHVFYWLLSALPCSTSLPEAHVNFYSTLAIAFRLFNRVVWTEKYVQAPHFDFSVDVSRMNLPKLEVICFLI